MLEEFQKLLKHFGYEIKDADLHEKANPLFIKAIQLAKDFASQRAIYQFFNPPKTEDIWTQHPKSEYCKNKEEEDEEGPDEGKIAFIIVPALMRLGTAMGEDLRNQTLLLSKAFVHLEE